MVASLGLGFILENIARFAYGNTARSFAIELARPFRFLDVRMNREQMMTLAISALAMTLMWLLLTRTPVGRAMRAVADNPQLALVRGIDAERIIRWTWFIAGILLAVGGVLIGMDRALEPPMGSNYVVGVFAAAILGGLGSALGALSRGDDHRRGERALHAGHAAQLPHRHPARRDRADPGVPTAGPVRTTLHTKMSRK